MSLPRSSRDSHGIRAIFVALNSARKIVGNSSIARRIERAPLVLYWRAIQFHPREGKGWIKLNRPPVPMCMSGQILISEAGTLHVQTLTFVFQGLEARASSEARLRPASRHDS